PYSSDDPEVTETGQRTYDFHQEIVVTGVESTGTNGAQLYVDSTASGTMTDDYYHRKEHYATCISSGPEILRYVFEDSIQYELVGGVEESDQLLTVSIDEDGSYQLLGPAAFFLVEGERTVYHYYIDNCHPGSEDEESFTEPWQLLMDSGGIEVSGTTDPEAPATLSGTHVFERFPEGIPTTVTITWNLRRNIE